MGMKMGMKVRLVEVNSGRVIETIKLVRRHGQNLGLREAKEIVEAVVNVGLPLEFTRMQPTYDQYENYKKMEAEFKEIQAVIQYYDRDANQWFTHEEYRAYCEADDKEHEDDGNNENNRNENVNDDGIPGMDPGLPIFEESAIIEVKKKYLDELTLLAFRNNIPIRYAGKKIWAE